MIYPYLDFGLKTAVLSISLKFSLETRLAPESLEPLIDFLPFLVQML